VANWLRWYRTVEAFDFSKFCRGTGSHLGDWWPVYFSNLGTIGFVSAGLLSQEFWRWFVFLCAFCLWIFGEWKRRKLTQGITEIKAERDKLMRTADQLTEDYFNLLNDQLSILVNDVFHLGDTE